MDQSFTINDTLTIILSDDKVPIDNLLPGQSADSSILDVTVLSNNPYGYKLSGTVGDSNYTADALYNTVDNTKTFTSIGYGNNKSTLNDFDANTWGYSYSLDGGTTWQGSTGNTGYTGLPLYNSSNTATFLDTDDISASTGDTMKFKIGAKASSTKESGEYNNTINFVATGYSFPLYTITYNANGGTVTPTSEQVRGTSVTLPTPTNGTKIFGGWCDGTVAGSVCSGTTYQAGTSYTPASSVTLTAIWQASVLADITRMDEMTTTICNNTTTGASKDLIDDRGTSGMQYYTVAKLADGKCWMTQNLRLTYSTSVIQVSDGVGGETSWTPERATSTWSNDYNHPYSWYASNYGAYYNWSAAVAMNDTSSIISSGIVVNTSICPKGWRLPQNADGAGSFYTLYNTSPYTSYSAMTTNPLNFQLTGYYSGSFSHVGAWGYYWSSTVYSNENAHNLYLRDPSVVDPQSFSNRAFGIPVRCVSI